MCMIQQAQRPLGKMSCSWLHPSAYNNPEATGYRSLVSEYLQCVCLSNHTLDFRYLVWKTGCKTPYFFCWLSVTPEIKHNRLLHVLTSRQRFRPSMCCVVCRPKPVLVLETTHKKTPLHLLGGSNSRHGCYVDMLYPQIQKKIVSPCIIVIGGVSEFVGTDLPFEVLVGVGY